MLYWPLVDIYTMLTIIFVCETFNQFKKKKRKKEKTEQKQAVACFCAGEVYSIQILGRARKLLSFIVKYKRILSGPRRRVMINKFCIPALV